MIEATHRGIVYVGLLGRYARNLHGIVYISLPLRRGVGDWPECVGSGTG